MILGNSRNSRIFYKPAPISARCWPLLSAARPPTDQKCVRSAPQKRNHRKNTHIHRTPPSAPRPAWEQGNRMHITTRETTNRSREKKNRRREKINIPKEKINRVGEKINRHRARWEIQREKKTGCKGKVSARSGEGKK